MKFILYFCSLFLTGLSILLLVYLPPSGRTYIISGALATGGFGLNGLAFVMAFTKSANNKKIITNH